VIIGWDGKGKSENNSRNLMIRLGAFKNPFLTVAINLSAAEY